MTYTTHTLTQGTPEWDAHRATSYNASVAIAAVAIPNPKVKRNDLVRAIATGEEKEFSKYVEEVVFANGHRYEDLARPLAEEFLCEDLFPVTISTTVDGLRRRLSASLDGATIDNSIHWEHKSLNAALEAAMQQGVIPEEYHPQMEQGMLIDGASRTLFSASKWDKNDKLIAIYHLWYESRPELRAKIIPGWKLVQEDADNYQHIETAPAIVVAEPDALPALMVEITGAVTASNFIAWQGQIAERIRAINTDLDTDEDFAVAEKTVKFLGEGETELARCKERALAQTASIDELFRAIDSISAEMRAKRLNLEKLVKARKESIRAEIAQRGRTQVSWHLEQIAGRIGRNMMPDVPVDFGAAMKGKKTVTSLNEAVDTAFADWRLRADAIADVIEFNLNAYADLAAGYEFLFQDLKALVVQPATAFAAMVELRINKHAEEVRRQDEEKHARIAAEERAKIENEQAEAERQRIAAEERAKLVAGNVAAPLAGHVQSKFDGEPAAISSALPAPAATLAAVVPDNGARITLGALSARLGFVVTADFLATFGFQAETDRSAKKYRACDFPRICHAIAAHVRKVAEEGMSVEEAA